MTHKIPLSSELDLLALHAAAPQRFPCLLETTALSTSPAGMDILLVSNGEYLELRADGRLVGRDDAADAGFLDALQAWYSQMAQTGSGDASQTPFAGGWVILLGYELAAEIEPRLKLPAHVQGVPTALALRAPMAIVRHRETGDTYAVIETGYEAWGLAQLRDLPAVTATTTASFPAIELEEASDQQFLDGVEKISEYIVAGDVFQVNLSRSWRADIPHGLRPEALYRALRIANPAPFSACLQWGDLALISSSPERLVRVDARRVDTRPIAGTRPRFVGDDDHSRIRELIGHPKERAEHIMLIDLERNDLGRVCVPGSVDVDELMQVESYAHVHHIVSNVRGVLREEVSPIDVIRAVFPGGTITGCPKLRCMEIIAELEAEGRGFYTGALGYLGVDGRMDLNILIRSFSMFQGRLEFRAGAGIVAESIAASELAETRAKARGLLRALGVGAD